MVNEKIIDKSELKGAKVEIVEMTQLEGANNGKTAEYLYFSKESRVSMKFVRITLNDSSVMTEAGALYFSYGNLEAIVETGGVGGMIRKGIKSKLTSETAFNPIYRGSGVVVLEPTFSHFALLTLDNDSVIVDKGLYYCSVGDIQVKASMQSNFSSAFAGGEGLFQTEIKGSGLVVLSVPVPMSEIDMLTLNNEKLQVDGNFALLRSGDIKFSVQKTTKSIIGTLASGEGLLNTFEGTGQVWLAPTAPMYKKIAFGGIGPMTNMNTSNNRQ